MDERLHAGRHHLLNGEKALRDGYLDDSRSHFEAALLQFRGPELRLGEAHALRGLARVELGTGNVTVAADAARAAIQRYQEVRAILRRVDEEGVSGELARDAEEGEGAAQVLLGDILLRAGRADEARAALAYAREIFDGLGEVPSVAGVWLAMGRLALRDGRLDAARECFDRAVAVHARSGDRAGECHGWLALADAHRLGGAFPEAEAALDRAVDIARATGDEALLGRSLAHQASLMLQLSRLDEAGARYDEALPLIRDGGDLEMEGFALVGLGDVLSRQGRADGPKRLAAGAALLAELDNRHGLGTAMLRVADHALRVGEPDLALAAAESARLLWYRLDPVRGVGQALRLEVKALAATKRWPAVVTVAHLRAAVAGQAQPNAVAVRDFYRAKAPAALLARLDALSAEALESRAEALVEQALAPVLGPLDLDPVALGTVAGALAVVEAVVARGPAEPLVAGAAETSQPPEERAEALPVAAPVGDPDAFAERYTPPGEEAP